MGNNTYILAKCARSNGLKIYNSFYLALFQEEYEYARVFPFTTRTEDELLEPFREDSLFSSLQLLKMNSYHMPDPFYLKWKEQGGLDSKNTISFLVYYSCNNGLIMNHLHHMIYCGNTYSEFSRLNRKKEDLSSSYVCITYAS